MNGKIVNCGICGDLLSVYNTTGQCFHHEFKRGMERETKFTDSIFNPKPQEEKKITFVREEEPPETTVEKIIDSEALTKKIIAIVAKDYGVNPEDIVKQGRFQKLVVSRQIVMYLLNTDFDVPLAQIGRCMSRDHTTVLYGCRQIEKKISEDKAFAQQIEQLRVLLQ